MTTIKIISGVYGHRPEKSPYVIPVTVNDPPISVEDDEAVRLVELGVAAYVDQETGAAAAETVIPVVLDNQTTSNTTGNGKDESGDSDPGDIVGNLDAEALKEWKMDDLKKLAADMGVDNTGIKKKDALIAAITAVDVTCPALDTEDVIE